MQPQVIGLEIDEPGVLWADWADNFVFCQSTLMASPGHRIYQILIQNILTKLDDMARAQEKDIANLELTFQDVSRRSAFLFLSFACDGGIWIGGD